MEVKVNQKVELEIFEDPAKGTYSSRVDEVLPDRLAVAWPTIGGLPIPATVGSKVRVDCISGQAITRLLTEILERQSVPIPVLWVARPKKVIRIQRRQYVRLEVAIRVKFGILMTSEPFDGPTPLMFEGKTRDISGGGVALATEISLQPGTQLDMVIDLTERRISAVGEVVQNHPLETEGEISRYLLGVRFIGIDERDRELIIKLIFREQRERRRRGLL